jgi:trk system potassium uptake protein TrkH
MLIGAISFVVHYNLFRKRFGELIDDVQNKVLFALCIIGTILLTIELTMRAPISNGILHALRLSSFQFVSAITCTGLQSTELLDWSPIAKLIISLAMIAGGAAGSTVGGIKLVRLILITKGANWKFLQTFMPSGMYIPKKLGKAHLEEEEMSEDILEAATLSFMYLILLVVGLLVMMHLIGTTYPVEDVIFEVCSAQGNVGMSVGITHAAMSTSAKWMLIINMWAGRLEIFPVLMLLQSIIFYIRPKRRANKPDVLG